jgi:sugar lactone lactonase YvrE
MIIETLMKNITKIIVAVGILLVCTGNIRGQVSPGGYVYSSTIHDSLSVPVKMAVDNADNIYVTDTYRKRIVKYDASGIFTSSFTTPGTSVSVAINSANQLYFGDGESGKIYRHNDNNSATLFYTGTVFPSSMTFDAQGLLYVLTANSSA